jgi:hypothetical protein
MRKVVVFLAVVCGLTWGAASYQVIHPALDVSVVEIPTLMVLPSFTPSATTTINPTISLTSAPSVTPPPTPSPLPSFTPTLATRVLEVNAAIPGGTALLSPTELPYGTLLLSAPPEPYDPLPDATLVVPPYEGWYSFESDHPNVIYATRWEPRQVVEASRGQYHRTEDVQSSLRFTFEGEALRVRYVAARNMGMFEVVIDGAVIDTIDAYAPELAYPATSIYTLPRGTHLLEMRPTGGKNAQSEGYVTALDAIHVYRGSANTLILTPQLYTTTPTLEPVQAVRIELVAAPPTMAATPTPPAPNIVRASVIIAYDENGNRAVDPAEGVRGISVRLVEAGTNRVVAQALTDSSGYAFVELVTSADLWIIVPYFGQVWDVSRNRTDEGALFTLLIQPANQPGLIP